MATGTWRLSGVNEAVRNAAEWALSWADYYGVPVTVSSGYRSLERQRQLRQEWELGRSKYPANKPGDSSHNYGLAWDSTVDPQYQDWWDYVRRLAGFEVLPNDRIHAQVPNWRSYV